jgi:hypothetical protein
VSYQQSRLLSSARLCYHASRHSPSLALTPRETGQDATSERLGACHIANLNCRHGKGAIKREKKKKA